MSCNAEGCEWLLYRATRIVIVDEHWTGECTKATQDELRERARSSLAGKVAKPSHVTKPCPDANCHCFLEDPDPRTGWKPGGMGELSISEEKGSCKLVATVAFVREFQKLAGNCLDPLPK